MEALNPVLTVLFQSLRALGRSRSDLILENLALRQQVGSAKDSARLRLRLDSNYSGIGVPAAENCRKGSRGKSLRIP